MPLEIHFIRMQDEDILALIRKIRQVTKLEFWGIYADLNANEYGTPYPVKELKDVACPALFFRYTDERFVKVLCGTVGHSVTVSELRRNVHHTIWYQKTAPVTVFETFCMLLNGLLPDAYRSPTELLLDGTNGT